MCTPLRMLPHHGRDELTSKAPHERFANVFLRTDDFHDAIIASQSPLSAYLHRYGRRLCRNGGALRGELGFQA
jgi:hypothetical protein